MREPRERASGEFLGLISYLRNVVLHDDCRDSWRWSLDDDGIFTVKALSKMVDDLCLKIDVGSQETMWCNLVPKKVNVFAWRALKKRLSVLTELDKRGIDLDFVLCPCCKKEVETIDHCLVNCKVVASVWVKIADWWKCDAASLGSLKY